MAELISREELLAAQQKKSPKKPSGVTKRLIRKNKKKSSFRKPLHHNLLMKSFIDSGNAVIRENHYTLIYEIKHGVY